MGDLVKQAVAFYAGLPPAARRSLRAMAVLADDQAVGDAAGAAGCGVIQTGMDLARKRGVRLPNAPTPMSHRRNRTSNARPSGCRGRDRWYSVRDGGASPTRGVNKMPSRRPRTDGGSS